MFKRTKIRQRPCVVYGDHHVIHGTEWQGRRNAARFGGDFHVHETGVRDRLAPWEEDALALWELVNRQAA